jgi:hypothetical protein
LHNRDNTGRVLHAQVIVPTLFTTYSVHPCRGRHSLVSTFTHPCPAVRHIGGPHLFADLAVDRSMPRDPAGRIFQDDGGRLNLDGSPVPAVNRDLAAPRPLLLQVAVDMLGGLPGNSCGSSLVTTRPIISPARQPNSASAARFQAVIWKVWSVSTKDNGRSAHRPLSAARPIQQASQSTHHC